MTSHNNIAGFSRLAPIYDLAAALGSLGAVRAAQQVIFEELQDLKAMADSVDTETLRVLIVGGGSGLPLEALHQIDRAMHITFIEPAPAMLRRAQRRAARLGLAVDFVPNTLASTELPKGIDVIFTPFFLDLFSTSEAGRQMSRLDTCLRPGGVWIEADFRTVGSGPLKYPSRLYLALLYRFFRWTCGLRTCVLPDTVQLFNSLNYTLAGQRTFLGGMIETSLLRKELK